MAIKKKTQPGADAPTQDAQAEAQEPQPDQLSDLLAPEEAESDNEASEGDSADAAAHFISREDDPPTPEGVLTVTASPDGGVTTDPPLPNGTVIGDGSGTLLRVGPGTLVRVGPVEPQDSGSGKDDDSHIDFGPDDVNGEEEFPPGTVRLEEGTVLMLNGTPFTLVRGAFGTLEGVSEEEHFAAVLVKDRANFNVNKHQFSRGYNPITGVALQPED